MAFDCIHNSDSGSHIISKKNKEHHISFNHKVEVIDIISYKKWNNLATNSYVENLFFGDNDKSKSDEDEMPKEKHCSEKNKKKCLKRYYNRDPNALRNFKCSVF